MNILNRNLPHGIPFSRGLFDSNSEPLGSRLLDCYHNETVPRPVCARLSRRVTKGGSWDGPAPGQQGQVWSPVGGGEARPVEPPCG